MLRKVMTMVLISGGLLVAALALVSDLLIAIVQRFVVSPGITGRTRRRDRGDARTGVLTEELAAEAT